MTGARLSSVVERRAPPSFWPVGLTVAVLIVSNVVSNRLLPSWAYVPWNATVALLLIVLARRVDHLLRIDLGIANVGHGLKIGMLLMAAVLTVYLVSWAMPATHGLFKDRRVGERSQAAMLYEVFIRIPLGTVLLEEVAFRGVLLGQLGSRLHWRVGLLVSSRSRTVEGVSGLTNFVMLPMWIFSGVFFSSSNFPAVIQPVVQALPLTALVNGLRAIMLQGAGLSTVWPQLAVLAGYLVVCLTIALRIFRWQ